MYSPGRTVDDDQIDAIIFLIKDIIDRMAQLDPHPFWTEKRENLVATGILNRGKAELTLETLENYV